VFGAINIIGMQITEQQLVITENLEWASIVPIEVMGKGVFLAIYVGHRSASESKISSSGSTLKDETNSSTNTQ